MRHLDAGPFQDLERGHMNLLDLVIIDHLQFGCKV